MVRAVGITVSGRPIMVVQRSRLCASAAITVQAALARNLPGGEVREGLVFEVADRELDHGVLAVLGLDESRAASVRLVRNAKWRQSGHSSACGADQAGAAHDQPLARRASSRAICASPPSG